jgi:hypothetical protein
MNHAGAYNGWTFGPGTVYHVNGLAGLYDLDDVKSNDLPRSSGGYFPGGDRPGGRTIVLRILLLSADDDAYIADLAPLVAATEEQDDELPLQLLGNTVYVMARPRGRTVPFDAENVQRSGIIPVRFFCSSREVFAGTP